MQTYIFGGHYSTYYKFCVIKQSTFSPCRAASCQSFCALQVTIWWHTCQNCISVFHKTYLSCWYSRTVPYTWSAAPQHSHSAVCKENCSRGNGTHWYREKSLHGRSFLGILHHSMWRASWQLWIKLFLHLSEGNGVPPTQKEAYWKDWGN